MQAKEVLDKIFRLPPVEQRPDITKSFIKTLTCPMSTTRKKDDTYIYFQCALTTFVFCAFISLLFFWMYLKQTGIEIGSFKIPFTSEKNYVQFFNEYSKTVSPILLYVILPFFVIKFRWNINPKEYDVLWFSPAFRTRQERKRKKIFSIAAVIIVMASVPLYWGLGGAWGWATEYFFVKPSILTIGLFLAGFSWVSAAFLNLFFISLIWIWAYLGEHRGSSLTD